MNKMNNIFLNNLPTLDLHGFDRETAVLATRDFILENYVLKNSKLVIIHGIGEGIVKSAVHKELEKNKKVISYKVDNFNVGCTIIEIKL